MFAKNITFCAYYNGVIKKFNKYYISYSLINNEDNEFCYIPNRKYAQIKKIIKKGDIVRITLKIKIVKGIFIDKLIKLTNVNDEFKIKYDDYITEMNKEGIFKEEDIKMMYIINKNNYSTFYILGNDDEAVYTNIINNLNEETDDEIEKKYNQYILSKFKK